MFVRLHHFYQVFHSVICEYFLFKINFNSNSVAFYLYLFVFSVAN